MRDDEHFGWREAAVMVAGSITVLAVVVALIHLLFSLEPELPQKLDGDKPALSHPIPYDATVTQDGRTRYYVRKEEQ